MSIKILDFWWQIFFNKIHYNEYWEWFLSPFPNKYLPWFMLILMQRFFSLTVLNTMTCLKQEFLFLSTQTTGGKCVFLFSFSGANQLLIIFNHIDLLPLFLPYRLTSDIIRSTISCIERKKFMHYSLHINTCTFIWNFQRSWKETLKRDTIWQRQELGQEN